MRLSAFKQKGEVVYLSSLPNKVYKTDSFTYSEMTPTNPFTTPSEDCFVIFELGNGFDVIRVGVPNIVMWLKGHSGNFNQSSYDGTHLGVVTAENVFKDYFKVTPISIAKGFFEKDGFRLAFNVPYVLPTQSVWSKKIILQPNRWQLIAIPEPTWKVKEDFLDKIASVTGKFASNSVIVVNTYFGSEDKFTSFVPDLTNPLSPSNFPLVYNDGGVQEVTAFWVKTSANLTDNLLLDWN